MTEQAIAQLTIAQLTTAQLTTAQLTQEAQGIPKAELHLHIEGSLEPELAFELADRNNVDLGYPDVESLRAAYSFTDLQSFLDIYYQGASVLRTEQDFHDLMAAYLRRAHLDGVVRAELFFDPQTHTERGIGYDVFMPGFLRAMDDAERATGISSDLILCFLRHLTGADALDTFAEAADYHDRIIGVGLDSGEVGNPPEDFAEVFSKAAEVGLHRVAHAGEEGPPAYIWGALDVLGAERIDHGVRAEEDAALVERLVEDQVPLTMCPLSNLALCVVDDLADHNIARLAEQGALVTVNSDDPAYFGGYIAENYSQTVAALGLPRETMGQWARNSIASAFATGEQKETWFAQLANYQAESTAG